MAIFNSYVKLPEGTCESSETEDFPARGGWLAAGCRCLGPAPPLSPAQRCGGGQRGCGSDAVEESDGLELLDGKVGAVGQSGSGGVVCLGMGLGMGKD
jgi:hypothetical protein